MESVTSSSRRSSSSYRYSTSSSFRSESSRAGSCDSLDALLEPFLDSQDSSSFFCEEGHGGPTCHQAPFGENRRSSYGHNAPVGGPMPVCQTNAGGVQQVEDSYNVSADVSQFEPHDVVVMAYNHHVVIHAEKVKDDGSVSDTFTHKSLFPKDMNPLSVCATFNHDGIMVVSVRRANSTDCQDHLPVPTYRSEAFL
ncbi:heat shock protein beta-7-like isoform X1 [Corythoichthys intestinalis]|uniref:heat shock protein beta-7-like isoform X1 n=1 Tax=Corythoichthys intestinalis TaxID=161448 RepID=UPI0025A687D9|nr:heat shock protein beta-7-like isoform X1 [Corythoichthys intestinalis]